MWRFLFYPQWNYEKAESWLSWMEQNGYRVERVLFCWWFFFVKSTPKTTQYIFTYNFLKEFSMGEAEHTLRSRYQANQIPSRGFLGSLFRITSPADLTEILRFREKYIRHVLREKILISLVFFLPCIGALIWSGIHAEPADVLSCILLCISSLSGIYILWNTIGLMHLRRK